MLSGLTELQSAALESVRMWQFEPPASGPVAKTVEISYGSRRNAPVQYQTTATWNGLGDFVT